MVSRVVLSMKGKAIDKNVHNKKLSIQIESLSY